jgi:hypothetical protein
MLSGMEYLYSKCYFPYANPFFPTYAIPFMDYAKYGRPAFYGNDDKVLDLSPVREVMAGSRLHVPYLDPRLSLTSYYQNLARMTEEAQTLPTSLLNRSLVENETLKREDVIDGPSSQKSSSPSRSHTASQGCPNTPPRVLSVSSLIASPSATAVYPFAGVNVPRYAPGGISTVPPMARVETTRTGQPLIVGTSPSSVHPVIPN